MFGHVIHPCMTLYQLLRFSFPCRAKGNYAKVVGTYGGASCFFLQINSRASGSPGKNVPDLWSDLLRSGSETNDTATAVCSTSVNLFMTMLIHIHVNPLLLSIFSM